MTYFVTHVCPLCQGKRIMRLVGVLIIFLFKLKKVEINLSERWENVNTLLLLKNYVFIPRPI